MSIRFKFCNVDDVGSLRQISVETFLDTYGHMNREENVKEHIRVAFNLEQLLSELRNPLKKFIFLYVKDNLAGYVKLNIGKAQTEYFGIKAIELERIYLLKAFQGKGYGRLFIKKAMAESRNHNCTRLWLGVWKRNPEAVAFYKKMGFEIFGEHTFTIGIEEQSDWMMDIKL